MDLRDFQDLIALANLNLTQDMVRAARRNPDKDSVGE